MMIAIYMELLMRILSDPMAPMARTGFTADSLIIIAPLLIEEEQGKGTGS